MWVDDGHFNIRYHLRHAALPDPGSHEQLRILMGRLMSQQLDRTKPLWELWIVENLSGGRWALVSKVHQALVDGIEGSDILTLMLTREPYTAGLEAEPWNPRPEPSDLDLVLGAGRDLATSPIEQYRAVTGVFDRPAASDRADEPLPLPAQRVGPARARRRQPHRPDRAPPPLARRARATVVGEAHPVRARTAR